MNYPKRLIEVDLPIKHISEYARQEKNIRQGHISSLHIWWARRPLAACRAVICAALWPDPVDERCPTVFREVAANVLVTFAERVRSDATVAELCRTSWSRWKHITPTSLRADDPACWPEMRSALLDFIADFSNWDASTIPVFMDTSRALTKAAHETLTGDLSTSPLVLDPFAGGGAMPLEALRLGADAFATDLNPIAALLNKVTMEYVPKYRNQLVEEVRKWGHWVKSEAKKELSLFYPDDEDGATPIGYLWARTITCEGPNCGVEVPIIKNQMLSSRNNSEASILVTYEGSTLRTYVLTGQDAKKISGGTSKRSSVTCPACGYTTPRTRVSVQANERGFGFHLLAICLRGVHGKRIYRQPIRKDLDILELADKAISAWELRDIDKIPAIPIEELPYLRSIFNVRVYGINQWYKLYHRRQLLSALIFTKIVREAAAQIKQQVEDQILASAVIESIALSVSNAFQYQCNIATYLTEGVKSAFIQGQSLPMKMDFIEANPLMDDLAGGYSYSLAQHLSGLEYAASFPYVAGTAQQGSALFQMLPEDSVDMLATDPPYYDVVPYADCSDFFYVWLRRMLHGFTTFPTNSELTPKDEEIVQLAERNERYRPRTKRWFEQKMSEALSVARASVKPAGIAVVVFAHKDTSAWEALLQSVLDAGWIVTGSWPIDTEKGSRLRANDSAVLGSSIHLVCRPRESKENILIGNDIGDWRDVLQHLPDRIHAWMPRLAAEGVVGADAIFACLGPALEIFSQYSRVEKANGDQVTLKEYLEHVWAAVAREALNMIFQGADATGFEPDARLVAMWLWTLSANNSGNSSNHVASEIDDGDEDEGGKPTNPSTVYTLEYDAVRKIAQGLGADLNRLTALVRIKGDIARLLSVAERTSYLFSEKSAQPPLRGKKRTVQISLFDLQHDTTDLNGGWGDLTIPPVGSTVLDRLHQSMILFGSGRGEALRRFLVEDGVGQDQRFWRLAQAFSALYPSGSDEKRWVDGVLSRKKSFGF